MQSFPLGFGVPGGLKNSTGNHVLYHKILGTLSPHYRPENTQLDSIYTIPGLSLIPVCKNISPSAQEHGAVCVGPYVQVLTDVGTCWFGTKKKSENESRAGEQEKE
jgi:hypothetical protein